jgi:serine/threonine-protein kinase
MTAAGLLIGTAAYMAPEQAKGRPADKRADVWAFGVLLHEILTGRRLFEGEIISDVLAAVPRDELDFDGLTPSTPPALRRLRRRCLERDPKRRLRGRRAPASSSSAGSSSAGSSSAPRPPSC